MIRFKKRYLFILIPVYASIILLFTINDFCPKDLQSMIKQFSITMFITSTIWLSVNTIFWQIAKELQDFKHTFKRIIILIPCILITTFLVYSIDYYILMFLVLKKTSVDYDLFFTDVKISLIATTVVYITYECVFFYTNWKKSILLSEKLLKENAIAQYESLKNQINPHFLFNSLNTLTAIIPLDTDKAVDFVQKLATSYRYLLTMREKELVDLQSELEFVNSYLFLVKTRYAENIQIQVSHCSTYCNLLLPPVSLQMLIENCIKHNVISKEKPLYIKIFIENEYIVVSNNFQAKHVYEQSTKLGLENIRKRYLLLSERTIEIQHTTTEYIVKLPLLKIAHFE